MRIEVADLVKFRHNMFDEYAPVYLVVEVHHGRFADASTIKLHDGNSIQHRVDNFILISKGKE